MPRDAATHPTSLAATIWRWLTSSRRRGRASTSASAHQLRELAVLDVDRLTRELDLLPEAARLGAAGLPDAQSRALSGPEALAVQRIEKARQESVDWAVRRLAVLERDLVRQGVTESVNRARQADKAFERAASSLLAEQAALLTTLRGAAHARQAELDAFKARNRLERAADYPSPSKKLLLYGVLLMMVAFEGVANSFFFAEGVSTGLVGGFIFAGAFAATNVALAFLFGKFALRQIAHVGIVRRGLGLVALPLAAAAMVTIALATAHMRDALASGSPDAAALALASLRATPFELAGIASWGLFLASLLFATVALVDGLQTDDRYPGYGHVARRALLAAEDYDAELEELRDDLEALRNDQLDELERDLREARAALLVQESLVGDKRATASRLANALRDAGHTLDALLRRFRTENEVHRGGAPRPAYFDTTPELAPLPQPDFRIDADEAALAQARVQLDALLAEIEALRARIQTAFNQQYDQLAPLDAHFAPGKPA